MDDFQESPDGDSSDAVRKATRWAPATLTEVAERAGVSRATAARAVGGYGSVSGIARELVLAAAAELKYRPNVIARNTRTGTSTTVGVVVADISNPFFGRSTRGISDAARKAGFKIVVVNTDEDIESERNAVQLLLEQRVAGIIVAPASRTDGRHLLEAQAAAVPVVLLDRRIKRFSADRVFADNRGGAEMAMRQLVDAGHRRIAYVSSAAGPRGASPQQHIDVDDLVTSGGDRIKAYVSALESIGADPRAYLRLCPFGEDAAYWATTELLYLPAPPSAVFASDSVIALGVLRAIHNAEVSIPDEVSVVAGDEPTWSCVTTPTLSTVTQPVHDLGHRAMDLLLKRLTEPDRPMQDVVLPTTFQQRGSTASLRTTPHDGQRHSLSAAGD